MKTTALASVLLLGACHSAAIPVVVEPGPAPASAAQGRPLRQPVVRLTEHGSWGSGLQSAGIPEFTLYADGLAVFARGSGEAATPMQVHLSPEETNALVDVVDAELAALDADIRLTDATDAPAASIGVATAQGRIYQVGVYGFGEAEAPAGFTAIHDLLVTWDHPHAEPWQPDELEIAMVRRDDLADQALPWPEGLPTPPADAREPRPRPMGRSGSTIQAPMRYRIDGALEPTLEQSLRSVTDGVAYAWNGSAWLVHYDRVIPERTYFW